MKDEQFDKELVEHFFRENNNIEINYMRYFKNRKCSNAILRDFYNKAKKYLEQRFEYFDGYNDALYRIKYGIEHRPKCKTCGKNYTRIIRDNKLGIYKYSDFCCCKCNRTSPETKRKQKETCLEIYGCEYASQNEEVKAKQKTTFHEHVEEIKAKIIKYNNEHYGVDWYFQSDDFKAKQLAYNMEHFGGPAPACSPEIQAKMQATSYMKYGTYFPSQSQEVKDKIAYTSYQKWGVKNYWASAYNQARSHSKESVDKCYNAKKANGTLKSSKSSNRVIIQLINEFPNLTFYTEYKDDRYNCYDRDCSCDLYIKELDLFIEFNFHWTHQHRFYRPDNKTDFDTIEDLKLNYKNASKYIDIWTSRDYNKEQIALHNKLNYFVVWDNGKDTINNLIEHIKQVIDIGNKSLGFSLGFVEFRSLKFNYSKYDLDAGDDYSIIIRN